MWRTRGCLHPEKNLLKAGQGWCLQRTHIDYTSGPWVSCLSGSPPPDQHSLIFYNIDIIKCAHSHQSPVEKGISQSASPRHLLTPQTAPPHHWDMVVVASCCGDGWEAGPIWGGCSYYGDVLEQYCLCRPAIWFWEEGPPSSSTGTLSLLLKQHSMDPVLEWPIRELSLV